MSDVEMEFVETTVASVRELLKAWHLNYDHMVMSKEMADEYGFVLPVRYWRRNRARKWLRKMHSAIARKDLWRILHYGSLHAKYAQMAGEKVQFWPTGIDVDTKSGYTATHTFTYGEAK